MWKIPAPPVFSMQQARSLVLSSWIAGLLLYMKLYLCQSHLARKKPRPANGAGSETGGSEMRKTGKAGTLRL